MHAPQTEVIADLDGKEIFRAVLPPGEYLVGRGADAAIRLRSDNVSRRHALLSLHFHEWYVEDQASANGTWVGGQRIGRATLVFPRQALRFGDVEVRLTPLGSAGADDSLDPYSEAVLQFLPPDTRGANRYKVHGLIGMGGMGAVLEAEELDTRRRVAMKVLLQTGAAENVARFVAEAQITAQLDHPNILPIYELSVNAQDKPFYTMKLVRGESLRQVLDALAAPPAEAAARFPVAELLRIFDKVCDAVAYAHAKRILHRDLKPDNILLGRYGEVWVTDWGLAKPLSKPSAETAAGETSVVINSLRHTDPAAVITTSGNALGSPQFMSPEQAAGSLALDERSDVYALGAILYLMLALEPPVAGESALEILENVLKHEIVPLAERLAQPPRPHLAGNARLDPLAAVVMQALAGDPGQRPASVVALQRAVRDA